MGKSQWVVSHRDKWAVRGEKKERVTAVFDTKQEAIKRGRQIAKNKESELIICNKDGTISQRESYGHDPFPPRDKEH